MYRIDFQYMRPQTGWIMEDFDEFPTDEQAIAAVQDADMDAEDITITSITEVD